MLAYAIALSSFFSKKGEIPFGISQNVRSLLIPVSQLRAIDLLNSTSARSPFWLRMFLQESAIALHLYQMPNLRSPFWNKSKSAISCLRWTGAIALLLWKGRSLFWNRKVDRSFFHEKVDRSFVMSQKVRSPLCH